MQGYILFSILEMAKPANIYQAKPARVFNKPLQTDRYTLIEQSAKC